MNFFNNNDPYSNLSCVENVTKYVLRNKTRPGFLMNIYSGGIGVRDLYNAGSEFMYIKKYFGKMYGRHIKHFYITFNENDHMTPELAYTLAYHICMYYSNRFQIIFSVHEEKKNLHIHFVVNSVSYIDGKKLHEGYDQLYGLESYCEYCYKTLKKSQFDN